MILTGDKIAAEVASGRITIEPFCDELLNPNSYNVRLGDDLLEYVLQHGPLDPKGPHATRKHAIPHNGMVLEPGHLYLGHTLEVVGSNHYVPLIGGRSSTGRLGLFVHITAPLGDIGYIGQWTLQLYPTVPVKLYLGQRVAQMIFVVPDGSISAYEGKYQSGRGPQAYRIRDQRDLFADGEDAYKESPASYGRLPKSTKDALQAEMLTVASHISQRVREGGRVLDVGCGIGLTLEALAQTRPDLVLVGTDRSQACVSACLERVRSGVLVPCDFFSFDWPLQSFDAVLMMAFVHLFPKAELPAIMRHVRPLLTSGGTVTISTSIHEEGSEGLEAKKTAGGATRYRARYTRDELLQCISEEWDVVDRWETAEVSDTSNSKTWIYLTLRHRESRSLGPLNTREENSE